MFVKSSPRFAKETTPEGDFLNPHVFRQYDIRGHAERDFGEFGTRRLRVIDEVGFGEHDHGLGARVERQHEFTFQPARAGGRTESVDEEDNVDVGGECVRDGAHPVEGGSPGECRVAVEHVVDLLAMAHERGCESELADQLTASLQARRLPDMAALRERFAPDPSRLPNVVVSLPPLNAYEALLGASPTGDAA